MSPPRVADPPVPGYRLAAPTALDVLTRLADCVGGVAALRRWSEVTGRRGLHGMDLELDDLDRVVDALAAQSGPLSVVALWAPRRLAAVDRLHLAAHDARENVAPAVADLLEGLAQATGTETVLVNAVLGDAVLVAWGLGGWAAETGGLPAEWAMCSTTAEPAATHVVADLAADPDWAETPLVAHRGLRSCAEVPLLTCDGDVVGTVCAISSTARSLDASVVEALALCAGDPLSRLEEQATGRGSAAA